MNLRVLQPPKRHHQFCIRHSGWAIRIHVGGAPLPICSNVKTVRFADFVQGK